MYCFNWYAFRHNSIIEMKDCNTASLESSINPPSIHDFKMSTIMEELQDSCYPQVYTYHGWKPGYLTNCKIQRWLRDPNLYMGSVRFTQVSSWEFPYHSTLHYTGQASTYLVKTPWPNNVVWVAGSFSSQPVSVFHYLVEKWGQKRQKMLDYRKIWVLGFNFQ